MLRSIKSTAILAAILRKCHASSDLRDRFICYKTRAGAAEDWYGKCRDWAREKEWIGQSEDHNGDGKLSCPILAKAKYMTQREIEEKYKAFAADKQRLQNKTNFCGAGGNEDIYESDGHGSIREQLEINNARATVARERLALEWHREFKKLYVKQADDAKLPDLALKLNEIELPPHGTVMPPACITEDNDIQRSYGDKLWQLLEENERSRYRSDAINNAFTLNNITFTWPQGKPEWKKVGLSDTPEWKEGLIASRVQGYRFYKLFLDAIYRSDETNAQRWAKKLTNNYDEENYPGALWINDEKVKAMANGRRRLAQSGPSSGRTKLIERFLREYARARLI